MAAKTSPFFEVKYGWDYGDDNWDVGMNENLRKFSVMFKNELDGIVGALPAMVDGQAFLNTSDGKLYFNIENINYSVEAPKYQTYYVGGVAYLWDGTAATVVDYVDRAEVGTTGASVIAANTPAQGRTALGLGSASTQPTSAFEPAITAGTSDQYWNGAKTFTDFPTSVRNSALTGLSTATTTDVVATDTVVQAIGKLQGQTSLKAPLSSPALTGTPTAPTATAGTNTTQIATTAFVTNGLTTKANIASPSFTGTPTAPTATQGNNSTQLATTAYVDTLGATKANLASPALTGVPTAPTAAAGTNTTQIATTAFVLANSAANTQQFAQIQDQKPSGTNGGSSVSAVWTTRTLNTTVFNEITGLTLSANLISLPAGTYYVEVSSPLGTPTNFRLRLWNNTDSSTVLLGQNNTMTLNNSSPRAELAGRFTISSSKSLVVQYYASTSVANVGLGYANSTSGSDVEIYTDTRIWRIS